MDYLNIMEADEDELLSERLRLEQDQAKLYGDIKNIKGQMTNYICGNPQKRSHDWYCSASRAKDKCQTIAFENKIHLDDINRELKRRKNLRVNNVDRLQKEFLLNYYKENFTTEAYNELIKRMVAETE